MSKFKHISRGPSLHASTPGVRRITNHFHKVVAFPPLQCSYPWVLGLVRLELPSVASVDRAQEMGLAQGLSLYTST